MGMQHDFATTIRAARHKLGISQREAAARAGISATRWADIERGRDRGAHRSTPTVRTAKAMGDVVGVDHTVFPTFAPWESQPVKDAGMLDVSMLDAFNRGRVAEFVEALIAEQGEQL